MTSLIMSSQHVTPQKPKKFEYGSAIRVRIGNTYVISLNLSPIL